MNMKSMRELYRLERKQFILGGERLPFVAYEQCGISDRAAFEAFQTSVWARLMLNRRTLAKRSAAKRVLL